MFISNFFWKQKRYFRIILPWFCATAVVTLIFVMLYVAVQQTYRAGANDPQIEVAENLVNALSAGTDPEAVIPKAIVPIDKSLSVFASVFDDALNPIISNATLAGEPPVIPRGVFDAARAQREIRVTWQPRPDVRAAIVVRHFRNDKVAGFVLVGRNLREIEQRERVLRLELAIAWVVSLLVIAARYLTKFFTGL